MVIPPLLEEEEEMGVENEKQKKIVLVGVRLDESCREIISWAIEKVAELGDSIVVLHVSSTCNRVLKNKSSLNQYLELYNELCSTKKIELKGEILKGRSVQRVLVKEAKRYNAVCVLLGVNNRKRLSLKTAKGCAKELPSTVDVLAIYRGNIIFRRSNHYQLLPLDQRMSPPSSEHFEELSDKESESKPEESTVISTSETGQETRKVSKRSLSLPTIEVLDQKPGWPLLRRAVLDTPVVQHQIRKVSVVNWVMSLPERFPHYPHLTTQQSFCEKQLKDILEEINRWFSYDVLKTATSGFSSENLIGKGGCNEVYKGVLEDGKTIAVKILKSSVKEAIKEFVHEVNIISSLTHKHISPLIGVCVQYNDLISVYNLSSRGSLEETLQGKQKDKHVLTWEERFKIAIGLAEAIDYLHNQCSKPVIHRDVKSSNVLLSDDFEPQLSDFGLSMWGSENCGYSIQRDVVGTFGYLAPEYFMYGKVSDKVDVYAFGVVLLELISGRTPISNESPRGQESLVIWAKPIIEKGEVKELLDPNISAIFDEFQFKKMVLAATHCITRAATQRPNIREVLKLLKEENGVEKWVKKIDEEDEDCFDDEVYPNSSTELHLSLAMLDLEDDDSVSSNERSNTSLFSSSSSLS